MRAAFRRPVPPHERSQQNHFVSRCSPDRPPKHIPALPACPVGCHLDLHQIYEDEADHGRYDGRNTTNRRGCRVSARELMSVPVVL